MGLPCYEGFTSQVTLTETFDNLDHTYSPPANKQQSKGNAGIEGNQG